MSSGEFRPIIVPVGGFLGSGKTTLIVAAARMLAGRGVKTVALLNDQGAELVDTRFVAASGVEAGQVTGGCFCCRFSDLIAAAESLRAHRPEVIFAEAVGSCTDISATVLQPLKLDYADRFRLAPYTVLVDRARAGSLADPELKFLFDRQVEEADLLCYSKADQASDFSEAPDPRSRFLSAKTGEGVAAWLDDVLGGRFPAGSKILEIDYGRYARAEAGLAWLNCAATVRMNPWTSPAFVAGPLLDGLDADLTARGYAIAHVKVMVESASGWIKASIVRNGGEPAVEGDLTASPAPVHQVLLNARAGGSPDGLRESVEAQLRTLAGTVKIRSLECFSPSPPQPEKRVGYVVEP